MAQIEPEDAPQVQDAGEAPPEVKAAANAAFDACLAWSGPLLRALDSYTPEQATAMQQANAAAFVYQENVQRVGEHMPEGEERGYMQALAMSLCLGQFLAASATDTENAVQLIHLIVNRGLEACQGIQQTMHAATESPQGHEGGHA